MNTDVVADQTDALVQRMRLLLDRECHFYGRRCRIIELLPREAKLVLAARDGLPPIQSDQYGQPASRGREHIEVELFNRDGGYSDDLMHLLDSVGTVGAS